LPATGVHVPALPDTSHASHCPVHALLQHTPSTQKWLAQAEFVPQDCPALAVPWHPPFSQNAPEAQLLAPVHVVGQVVVDPVQRYG
jgi:hypothetical protein